MPAETGFQSTNNFGAASSAWALYDALIEGIDPTAKVVDFVLGVHWSALQATCGCQTNLPFGPALQSYALTC